MIGDGVFTASDAGVASSNLGDLAPEGWAPFPEPVPEPMPTPGR